MNILTLSRTSTAVLIKRCKSRGCHLVYWHECGVHGVLFCMFSVRSAVENKKLPRLSVSDALLEMLRSRRSCLFCEEPNDSLHLADEG
jgi:hypothetical protein